MRSPPLGTITSQADKARFSRMYFRLNRQVEEFESFVFLFATQIN